MGDKVEAQKLNGSNNSNFQGQPHKIRKFSYPENQEQLNKIYEQKHMGQVKRLKPNDQVHNYSDQKIQISQSSSHSSNSENRSMNLQTIQTNQINTPFLDQQTQFLQNNVATHQGQKTQNQKSINPSYNSFNNLLKKKYDTNSSEENKDKSHSSNMQKEDLSLNKINQNLQSNLLSGLSGARDMQRKRSINFSSGGDDSIDYDQLQRVIDLTASPKDLQTPHPNNLHSSIQESKGYSLDSNMLQQIDEIIEQEELLEQPNQVSSFQQLNNKQNDQNSLNQNFYQLKEFNSDSNQSIEVITKDIFQETLIAQQKLVLPQNDIKPSRNVNQSRTDQEQKQMEQIIEIGDFFLNRCFNITKMLQNNPFHIQLELTLAVDSNSPSQIQEVQQNCCINFKLNVIGNWAKRLFAEVGDMVRVIGNFCRENNYQLTLDDNENELNVGKASMLIVEPYIMIPCTSIVKAFPCPRNAMLSHQYKGLNTDINYALVLGNTIHGVFQSILQNMDFSQATISKTIQDSIQDQLLSLYFLKKTEEEVERDVKRGVNNITKWLSMLLKGDYNQYGIKYRKFLAAEQEFNSATYGIKGNIDSTIVIEDQNGIQKSTALEIKTGKNKSNAYRGQVLLYSLLISERFKNANPENILLYIMDENIKEGFQYIRQSKLELDNIVMGRNELAKWQKINSQPIFQQPQALQNPISFDVENIKTQGDYEDLSREDKQRFDITVESMDYQIVKFPPMIKQTGECKYCFARNVCSITALSLEKPEQRKAPQGQFPAFLDMEKTLSPQVKFYYKKFIECIQLEQNAETNRNTQNLKNNQKSQNKNPNSSSSKETGLRITSIISNQKGGSIVTLEKAIKSDEANDGTTQSYSLDSGIQENTFVNLSTEACITFSKGCLTKKEIDFNFRSNVQSPIKVQGDASQQKFSQDQSQKQVEEELKLKYKGQKEEDTVINSSLISDLDYKLQDVDRYFSQYIIYTIEFAHLMPQNLSSDALGGRDPLSTNPDQQVNWTIESEPFSNFSYSMMRSNVLALCTDNRFDQLKNLFILNRQPTEIPQMHLELFLKKFSKEMVDLNDEQRLVVGRSVMCKEYHLIQGVPGSGKTKTVATLIKILALIKKKVLLVNFSNSQVDNVLIKLKESGFENFVRLSSNQSSVDIRIRDKVVSSNDFKTMEEIDQLKQNISVFGMTCLALNNPILLALERFDYCIFDDASQISEPLALGPMFMSDKFVMAGDYLQTGIALKSFVAERKGIGKSLFERLCKQQPQNVSKICLQYRFNSEIMELTNKIFYDSQLLCNREDILNQKVIYKESIESFSKDIRNKNNQKLLESLTWLDHTRCNNVLFLQTDDLVNKIPEDYRYKNKNSIELSIIKLLLKDLYHNAQDINNQRIVVITPTQEYASYLYKELKQDQTQQDAIQIQISQEGDKEQIEQQRVLQFKYDQITSIEKINSQMECSDILIFACGLWNGQMIGEVSQKQVITDQKKLNYVITRTKKKLIIIGSKENIKSQKLLNKLYLCCKMKGWLKDLSFDSCSQIISSLPNDIQNNCNQDS